MTTALAKSDFTASQIETIRNAVARGATDSQLALFLEFCKSRNLDPFTKQVHWTPKGIIAGIDGLRAIAERAGNYMPGPTRYEYDAQGALVAAHTTIRKKVDGKWFDLEESAYWEEYAANTPVWARLKRVMLSKCSEARALRRAFPLDLSGIYGAGELDQAYDSAPAPAAPIYTVEPVRTAPEEQVIQPVRPTSMIAQRAMDAISQAADLAGLKVAAGLIVENKAALSPSEADALRIAYSARRDQLGGSQ